MIYLHILTINKINYLVIYLLWIKLLKENNLILINPISTLVLACLLYDMFHLLILSLKLFLFNKYENF